jgi:hypothetical protein
MEKRIKTEKEKEMTYQTEARRTGPAWQPVWNPAGPVPLRIGRGGRRPPQAAAWLRGHCSIRRRRVDVPDGGRRPRWPIRSRAAAKP